MSDREKIIGSTRIHGVALTMHTDKAGESFELAWEGNGLSGREEINDRDEAAKAWQDAIASLRANPEADPVIARAMEMAI